MSFSFFPFFIFFSSFFRITMCNSFPPTGHDAITQLNDLGNSNYLLGMISLIRQQHQEKEDIGNNCFRLPENKTKNKVLSLNCTALLSKTHLFTATFFCRICCSGFIQYFFNFFALFCTIVFFPRDFFQALTLTVTNILTYCLDCFCRRATSLFIKTQVWEKPEITDIKNFTALLMIHEVVTMCSRWAEYTWIHWIHNRKKLLSLKQLHLALRCWFLEAQPWQGGPKGMGLQYQNGETKQPSCRSLIFSMLLPDFFSHIEPKISERVTTGAWK